jgi:hypothetical protein
MSDLVIEQAVLHRTGSASRLVARSPGFGDDWQVEAERLASAFGEPPEGMACPAAVFAQPLGKQHVAIVQVADLGAEAAARPAALGFHFLIVPRDAYNRLWGDPFLLADRVPPSWQARGSVPTLTWPADPLPRRMVQEVQTVLQRTKTAALPEDVEVPTDGEAGDEPPAEEGLSPALLGGTQVLVDGGKVVFERPGPDPELIRGLWTLLPASTRCQLWPATFAFANTLQFDALVVPPGTLTPQAYPGYTNEDQACEYPQGYYELNLQIAAEAGNQAELDALFARRSWAEMWRLGLTLLVVFTILAVALNLLQSPPAPTPDPEAKRRRQAAAVAGLVGAGTNPWTAVGLLRADKRLPKKPIKELP